jgi:hypothetical protein
MASTPMGLDVVWRLHWPEATAHKGINAMAEAWALAAD